MEIHEVVDNSRLQIILYTVDYDMLAHIHDFQIRQVTLSFVNRLIDLFVVANAVPEVLGSRFRI